MRILTWILVFSLSFNLLAAPSVQTLVENYNYTMAVEWDQKDVTFHQQKTQEFVLELIKSGARTEDFLAELAKKDPTQFATLKLRLEALSLSSPEAIARSLFELSPSVYAKGASWNGAAVAYSAGMLVVLAVAIYAITAPGDQVCAKTSVGDHCELVSSDQVVCSYGEYCSKWKSK